MIAESLSQPDENHVKRAKCGSFFSLLFIVNMFTTTDYGYTGTTVIDKSRTGNAETKCVIRLGHPKIA
jgi:hypothetical protein